MLKTIELELNKRLLIVEYTEMKYLHIDYRNTKADNVICLNGKNVKVKAICKGSEFTEDMAEGLVEVLWKGFKNYSQNEPVGNYKRLVVNTAMVSFISAIQAKGWHWGENPYEKEVDSLVEDNSAIGCAKYRKAFHEWQESESRTLYPEKCIIYEIL